MSYQVLARKWRPQSFQDLVGQEHVVRTLENAVRDHKNAHAYLFSGMRGIGKTTVARILAKTLNCEHPVAGGPCQECSPCREITSGCFVDVLEIDGASNTGVDNVREIQENARYAPLRGKYKVYIIDEVHMLSRSAFNALLKTLEEPPPHVLFIFATTEPYKIPATILCRCQHFHFRRFRYTQVIDRLRFILREEGITVPDRSLARIAKASEGSLRDALTLLDQILAYAGGEARDEDIAAVLGSADHFLDPFLRSLLEKNGVEALRLIQGIAEGGLDLRIFCGEVVETLRHLIVLKLGVEAEALLDLPEEEIALLRERSSQPPMEELQRLYTLFVRALEEMRWAPVPRFSLEMAAIRAVQAVPLRPVEDLLRGLAEMEGRAGGESSERGISPSVAVAREKAAPPHLPPDLEKAAPPPVGNRKSVSPPTPVVPSPNPSTAASADLAPLWHRVVEQVSAKRPALGTCLESTIPLGMDDRGISVEVRGGTFCLDLLQKPENLVILREAVRIAFDRVVPVRFAAEQKEQKKEKGIEKVVPDPPLPSAEEFEAEKRERVGEEVREAFGGDPMVAEALRLFGGKVVEIHPVEPPAS